MGKDFLKELNEVIAHNDIHFNTKNRVDRLFEAGVAKAYTDHADTVWVDVDAWAEYFNLYDKMERTPYPSPEYSEMQARASEVYADNTSFMPMDGGHSCLREKCRLNCERIQFPVLGTEPVRFDINGVETVNYHHLTGYTAEAIPAHKTIYGIDPRSNHVDTSEENER